MITKQTCRRPWAWEMMIFYDQKPDSSRSVNDDPRTRTGPGHESSARSHARSEAWLKVAKSSQVPRWARSGLPMARRGTGSAQGRRGPDGLQETSTGHQRRSPGVSLSLLQGADLVSDSKD